MADFNNYLDRKCKKFLNYLRSCEKYTLDYLGAAEKLKRFGDICEVEKMIEYLNKLEYVKIITIEPEIEAGVTLQYKGIHWKKFNFIATIDYLKEKWIDFISMATSVIALILSLTALLSQPK